MHCKTHRNKQTLLSSGIRSRNTIDTGVIDCTEFTHLTLKFLFCISCLRQVILLSIQCAISVICLYWLQHTCSITDSGRKLFIKRFLFAFLRLGGKKNRTSPHIFRCPDNLLVNYWQLYLFVLHRQVVLTSYMFYKQQQVYHGLSIIRTYKFEIQFIYCLKLFLFVVCECATDRKAGSTETDR